jgi:hypothetical protein
MRLDNYLTPLIALILFVSCAKQSTPTGGAKDLTPPKLLSSNPVNESINTKPSSIELLFDEYIKAETPNKQIIITPRINKDEMQVTASRNKILIQLNQELEDSTTYVFNFQKSIQDITENNPAENLKLVFSTGSFIDSLKVTGRINYVFPQRDDTFKDVFVGLYPIGDTTDILTGPPYYISQVDSTGTFTIANIKNGEYRAYSWFDSNNSLKAEDKNEAYGFFSDTIVIKENVTGIDINLTKSDLTPFRINRSSPSGANYDMVLNKTPVEIHVKNEALNKSLFYRLNEKTIRFYHPTIKNDSLPIYLNLIDSVGFKIDTLIYAKFEESERAKEKLEPGFGPEKPFLRTLRAELNFNKPIYKINYDSLLISYDTASVIKITPEQVDFPDPNIRTKLIFQVQIPQDINFENFKLIAGTNTFEDVDGLKNEKKIETSAKRLKKETLSEDVTIKVNTDELPLIVQILNKGEELIAENYLTDSNIARFVNLEGGTYHIRAIVDRNKNRRWDTSNMLQNRQAEPVYYLYNENEKNTRDITIRGGWSMELEIHAEN